MNIGTAGCRHENSQRRRNRRGQGMGHDHGGHGGYPAYICQDCGLEYCADERCPGYGPDAGGK